MKTWFLFVSWPYFSPTWVFFSLALVSIPKATIPPEQRKNVPITSSSPWKALGCSLGSDCMACPVHEPIALGNAMFSVAMLWVCRRQEKWIEVTHNERRFKKKKNIDTKYIYAVSHQVSESTRLNRKIYICSYNIHTVPAFSCVPSTIFYTDPSHTRVSKPLTLQYDVDICKCVWSHL